MTEMNEANPRILLVDDDTALCDLLSSYLSSEGFTISAVHDGQAALDLLRTTNTIDAVVLDIMMPGLSGIDVLQQLRPRNNTPVIMLTGRGDDIDRILGLEMGADDYLGKPCNPRELSARLKAILRRGKPLQAETTVDPALHLHGIELDPANLRATVSGNPLALTSAEFKVLELLMRAAGQVLSKETLTEQVLHRKLTAYDRSIDVHVSRIRKKLAQGGLDNIIRSIRGVGYQMLVESNFDD